MSNVIKQSFRTIIKNSATIQPLVIYIFTITLLNTFMGMRLLVNNVAVIIFAISNILLMLAFFAGWFQTIKYAVDNFPPIEKSNNAYRIIMANYNIDTLKTFFSGVGEYFLPMLGFALCITIFAGLFFGGIYLLGQKMLVSFPFDWAILVSKLNNPQSLSAFFAHITPMQMKHLAVWIIYFNIAIYSFQFFILLWIPTIYYKTKNPIKSFSVQIVYLFKNFFHVLGIYLFLLAASFAINLLVTLSKSYFILSFIFLILYFYFVTYIFIVMFTYFRNINLTEKVQEINEKDVFIKSTDNSNNLEENEE